MTENNFITPELRSDIDRVNKDCIRLHVPPPPFAFVSLEVQNEKGETVHKHSQKCNSWNRNFYNMLCHQSICATGQTTFGAGYITFKNTSGTVRTLSASYANSANNLYYFGKSDSYASAGIVLGSTDAAENFEDYQMPGAISHGNSTGQMMYTNPTIYYGNLTYDAVAKKYTNVLTREIQNASSAAITVKSTGLLYASFGGNNDYALVERTVLAAPVEVPAGYKISVEYTLDMTFPA